MMTLLTLAIAYLLFSLSLVLRLRAARLSMATRRLERWWCPRPRHIVERGSEKMAPSSGVVSRPVAASPVTAAPASAAAAAASPSTRFFTLLALHDVVDNRFQQDWIDATQRIG
jgi:hypothetical protein